MYVCMFVCVCVLLPAIKITVVTTSQRTFTLKLGMFFYTVCI
jgi:hypothetical protein